MTLTDDQLSAFLDGELPPLELKRIAALIDADAALRRRIEALALPDRLIAGAYSAIDAAPIPAAVTALLADPGDDREDVVVPMRRRAPTTPAWSLPLAASLALAAGIGLGLAISSPRNAPASVLASSIDAKSALYAALETRPSGDAVTLGAGETATLILSFDRGAQGVCREFALAGEGEATRAVACRKDGEWRIAFAASEAPADQDGTYGTASSPVSAAFESAISALGADRVIEPSAEASLIKSGWAAAPQ